MLEILDTEFRGSMHWLALRQVKECSKITPEGDICAVIIVSDLRTLRSEGRVSEEEVTEALSKTSVTKVLAEGQLDG